MYNYNLCDYVPKPEPVSSDYTVCCHYFPGWVKHTPELHEGFDAIHNFPERTPLLGKVPGLLEIKVQTECLESSNVDVMLYSVLENEEALKGYAVHPEHVAVADNKVRPFTQSRNCIDFEEK